ncbi:rubrerythrin [Criibacterium bergeronii]|uniref:Rubrerythrin n=1 Tax=Criibacterium bergeronii TaxID=1871336 RepID=A0A552VE54_9FIRM|nr:rubrerythrin [Criibacterium bergeronii]TRW28761.1 rubrerythrin [Criibacterium bergeronii]
MEDNKVVYAWKCTVCGYISETDRPPKECPICHVGAEKFMKIINSNVK